jgi:hypothetical protein
MSKTKYYKIVPIKHLLKNNQTAKAGDIVSGNSFVNLQDSLERGFCKETKETPKGVDKKADEAKAEAEAQAQEKAEAKAAKKAKKAQAKAEKEAKAEAEKEAKAQAKAEAKETSSEEPKEVDLEDMSEKELIGFAKENKFKLTAATIKKGREAIIEAIIKASEA